MTDADERERIREQKRQELMERVSEEDGSPDGESGESASPDEPIHVEGADHFEAVTGNHDVALVDYYADWCGPCQMLEPIVETIAADTDAAVAKVDIDRHQGLAQRAGVRGVPTLELYVDGEVAERLVGMQDEGTLRGLVEQHA